MSEFREISGSAGLKYNAEGLVSVIVIDQQAMAIKGLEAVLMQAWADSEAIDLSLSTRKATFWSRSRQELWVKGETSGNSLWVSAVYADCDLDCLLYDVKPMGPACHNRTQSCFQVADGEN